MNKFVSKLREMMYHLKHFLRETFPKKMKNLPEMLKMLSEYPTIKVVLEPIVQPLWYQGASKGYLRFCIKITCYFPHMVTTYTVNAEPQEITIADYYDNPSEYFNELRALEQDIVETLKAYYVVTIYTKKLREC